MGAQIADAQATLISSEAWEAIQGAYAPQARVSPGVMRGAAINSERECAAAATAGVTADAALAPEFHERGNQFCL